MNASLDLVVYAGTLVAASIVGGMCLVGLIVWLAGGEGNNPPKATE